MNAVHDFYVRWRLSLDRDGILNFNWVDPGGIIPGKSDLERMYSKKSTHTLK